MTSVRDYVLLPSGTRMPILGLGTWGLVDEELKRTVDTALSIGYRHIDTAYFHFNEEDIGAVLRDWLESKRIRRKDIFVTSKLPPTGMTPEKVKHFCQLSLKNLGLAYLDLYLIQLPVGLQYKSDDEVIAYHPDGSLATECDTELGKVWMEMEKLVDEGLVNNIGLCNFNQSQIESILESAIIKPANLQIEVNAYFQQRDIRMFCKESGIPVTAFCPLGSPGRDTMLLSHRSCKAPHLLEDPVVKELSDKCGKTPAQVLLRHAIQKQICVIPKSSDETRLRENFEIFNFYLIPNEMRLLDTLNTGQFGRSFNYSFLGESFLSHKDFPFVIEVDDSRPPAH